LADAMDPREFDDVGLVNALDIPAKSSENAFRNFDLLRPTDHCGQEFCQAAGGSVGADAVSGLLP
jgi:hypothetical protein